MSAQYNEQARAASRAKSATARTPTVREDRIVERAVNIIAPREAKIRACRLAVQRAMQAVVQNEVERQWQGIAKTEDGKQAVRTLGKRLRRVVNWWQDECHEFPPELMPNALLLNKLTALAVRCEEIAKAKSGKVEKDAPAKYDAAVHAYRLLKWFGVKKKIPAHDKESDFCRLAALLMNDSRADLTWQCKKYKKEVLARARKKNVLAPSKKVS